MNVIAATDLLFPDQHDPIGRAKGGPADWGHDRRRYVVWVDTGRPHQNGRDENYRSLPELAPRTALHLVRCRNGGAP